jgi:pyrimidine operon attenuation protein / uracil phosphoribosyltransferase
LSVASLKINTLLKDLATAITQDLPDSKNVVLIGILTRGYPLAKRLATLIKKETGTEPPVGKLDITLYRDDLEMKENLVKLKETYIPTSIEGKTIILVDDVLFHGRTARAAMDNILDYGRPKQIKLAVLIDRGHKEFPIAANYIGATIETEETNQIKVTVKEIDGIDKVTSNV